MRDTLRCRPRLILNKGRLLLNDVWDFCGWDFEWRLAFNLMVMRASKDEKREER